MRLSPTSRKVLLTGHMVASVGWIGALAVFLAHAIASRVSDDPAVIRAAAMAMSVSAWFVILPLSIGTLFTGLLQAFGTAWGLLRHYWVAFKLELTLLATGVLLMKLGPISDLTTMSMNASFAADNAVGLRTSVLVHALGGLVILLVALVLAVFKPAGVTSKTPRWARVFMFVLAAAVLLLLVMLAAGQHGPSAHMT